MASSLFHTYGDHAVELMLRKTGERAEDPKPQLEEVGKEMLNDEHLLFETAGFSANNPWRPLSKETVRSKSIAGYARPSHPLIATGDEERSLSERGARYNIFRVTKGFVLIGSTHPAVGFQTRGTKDMPRRDPMEFTPQQVDKYIDMMSDYVFTGKVNRAR